MPNFVFECEICRQQFEIQTRLSDGDAFACETCGGTLLAIHLMPGAPLDESPFEYRGAEPAPT